MTAAPDRLVIFRAGGARLALPLSTVAEVSELPDRYPIPFSPACFKGVINSHGRLVSLLDLSQYLVNRPAALEGKVLILDRRLADLALWVDGVERIIPVDEVLSERDSEGPLEERILTIVDGEMAQLSASGLVEALEADLHGIIHAVQAENHL